MTDSTIWDPLRKKEVALTPEEKVRQWFISMLQDTMHVPLHMMMSETSFRLGDKLFRADIIVYDRKAAPLAVVECKRPEVEIDSKVLDQAIRYNMVLDVRYIIITNGKRTFICRKKEGCVPERQRYEFISHAPSYSEMLGMPANNGKDR
ncbi:MAG: type I restriction enzyme HsdR N-terminal domain-containing protein [Bacteroidetes bacterium]|uniref:Type I restriction enzyme HsdR N-terminal domain-containing protein n=1 Tax=Candidatus Cryptobacteroides excrementavium TaxID=2840759 RepID=A0A9D9J3B5_9BACT|nr:type I restriction enzyme HsdR N-terminal domain-containing protein [Candidatus Cryptobacteroides excrementavium]